jgi:hypothetical protein
MGEESLTFIFLAPLAMVRDVSTSLDMTRLKRRARADNVTDISFFGSARDVQR